ncbi:MAG: hypothetical protein SO073_04315 [Candidatus Onthomonas sp.]|nr:hypothetical protein [Candidatus Onthomonas sp.]
MEIWEKRRQNVPEAGRSGLKSEKGIFLRGGKSVAIIKEGKTLQKFFSNRCNKIACPRINQVERGRPS